MVFMVLDKKKKRVSTASLVNNEAFRDRHVYAGRGMAICTAGGVMQLKKRNAKESKLPSMVDGLPGILADIDLKSLELRAFKRAYEIVIESAGKGKITVAQTFYTFLQAAEDKYKDDKVISRAMSYLREQYPRAIKKIEKR